MAPRSASSVRPRVIVRCIIRDTPSRSRYRVLCCRSFTSYSQRSTAQLRPNLPFLHSPVTSGTIRYFTSTQKQWFKHEIKLAVRYTLAIWGIVACVFVIVFFVEMDGDERKYPTPAEWSFVTRGSKRLVTSYRDEIEDVNDGRWGRMIAGAREVIKRLEDPNIDGQGLIRVVERYTPPTKVANAPYEFCSYDISSKSEEWRRGYFEILMLIAEVSQNVEGWLCDVKLGIASPPEYVFGPSNPHPLPLPPGRTQRPREEDCVPACPPTEDWFVKILATKGFTSRQRIEAALAYANFLSNAGRPDGVKSLHELALAEATKDIVPSQLPYDPKTLALKNKANCPPSANVLDILTDVALHKVRDNKDGPSALPIFVSILKARRSLANTPPPQTSRSQLPIRKPKSMLETWVPFISQHVYPPPPPDGMQPPWRSPTERCEEAALNMYIGEILFASSSHNDGLAWTRDAVDAAEDELRGLRVDGTQNDVRKVCRDCLRSSLGNWHQMVSRLAAQEKSKQGAKSKSSVMSFWSGSQDEVEGRWEAELALVEERVKRTEELTEDIKPDEGGLMRFFKA